MKRHGGLWDVLVSWPNLVQAARKARKGKRSRPAVQSFDFNQEHGLLKIQQELESGSYRPGEFRTHRIIEPKPRIISAAPQQRVPSGPAFSLVRQACANASPPQARNCAIHGSRECGLENPDSAPVPACRFSPAGGRTYGSRPYGAGRAAPEGPMRPSPDLLSSITMAPPADPLGMALVEWRMAS